jgi:signal transduction histidine kinase
VGTDRASLDGVRGTEPTVAGRVVLARVLLGVTVALTAGAFALALLDRTRAGAGRGRETLLALYQIPYLVAFVAVPVVAYAVASRRPENRIGWLLSGVAVAFGLDLFLTAASAFAVHGGQGGRPLGSALAVVETGMWVFIVVPPITFLILLFPSGHLPSRRWRWPARIFGGAMVLLFAGIVLAPGPIENSPVPGLRNPLGVQALRPLSAVFAALAVLIPMAAVAAVVSLARRFRRSSGVERHQLRLLVIAASVVGLLYAIAIPVGLAYGWTDPPGWAGAVETVTIMAFALIPVAIGVSVLRYRLFEIEVVVNRALLFGVLGLFITAVYVAVVVGVGALVGSRASPVLSAVAAAIVALAFLPARRRAQRLADRLVYGERASPYEVLSAFSERLGNAYAVDELLPRIAQRLAEGTGAERVDVWLRFEDELRSAATWPPEGEPVGAIAVADAAEESVSPVRMFEPVRHQGELLGALSVTKRPGDAVTAIEERLVRDLAGQAGLVMRNVALTERLLENVEQLRASRQRLVTAQDEERRKLERNLHDGAQQQLVALAIKLRLLEQLVERNPEVARDTAASLQADAQAALAELRDLARGIYPPLLADRGLVAALEAQARRSTVEVAVEAVGVGRYPREVEAAVYFSCLEALQNVAKYAEASRATVRLSDGDARLRFEVADDGRGFDASATSYGTGLQGIADRLAALGGTLAVRSAPGAGTTLAGELPVPEATSEGAATGPATRTAPSSLDAGSGRC